VIYSWDTPHQRGRNELGRSRDELKCDKPRPVSPDPEKGKWWTTRREKRKECFVLDLFENNNGRSKTHLLDKILFRKVNPGIISLNEIKSL
jgi:hypothetical protein